MLPHNISTEEIGRRLRQGMGMLARVLAPAGKLEGEEWVALNPTRPDRNPGSFRICVSGAKCGLWREFASGDGGDPFALIQYVQRCSFKEAIEYAKSFLSIRDNPVPSAPAAEASKPAMTEENKRRKARALWLSGQPVSGTPAERYLAGRGINFGFMGWKYPAALRFVPGCYCSEVKEELPAMVAMIFDKNGEQLAVHRTYLWEKDGRTLKAPLKNPKMTFGRYVGGFIPLWRGKSGKPIKDAPADDVLILCEGIEDALTLALLKPEARVLSAVSVANLGSIEVPEKFKTIIIAPDNDKPTSQAEQAFSKAVERLKRVGGRTVSVSRPPAEFKDWNDFLNTKEMKK